MRRKVRTTLGLAAAVLTAATGSAVAAAPASAEDTSCPTFMSQDYACYFLQSSDAIGWMGVRRLSDGHDYIEAAGFTDTNPGQNIWVLTANGSGGWNWKGYPMNQYDGYSGWWGYTPLTWDGNGTLIKIALYSPQTGSYVYSTAH